MKVNTIEQGNYQGYLWKSDASEPRVLNGEPFTESLVPMQNPFIIEGQLYDADRHVSYSIRYVDGQYIIHRWDLENDLQGDDFEYTEKEAVPHRIKSGKLIFRQYWKAEPDALCEGMKVLNPHALVFVGFKLIKENAL